MRNKDRTKPKTWRKVKLGDIANLFMQQVNPKNLGDIVVDHFSIPAFDAGRLPIRESASQIQSNKFVVPKGAVLLSKLNPRIPRVWKPIIQKDIKALASTEFMVFVPKEDIDRDFLYYLFQKRVFLATLAGQAGGTSTSHQRAIPKAVLDSKVEIPTDINEQKRIANILSAFDEKIELNNKINQTLEQMAQAIFKEWFIKFNFPVEFEVKSEKLKVKSLGYKDAGGKMVDRELGKIPKGWEVKMLPEVFDFLEGPGIRNWQYTSKGCPFINIRLIQNNDIDVKSASFISEEEANGKYKHFHLQERDMVVSTSGTLGRSAIVRKEHLPLLLNTSVIRFRPKDRQSYAFMYQFLNSAYFQNKVLSMASGSAQPNFGPVHLKQIKVLVPGQKMLNIFGNLANPIYEKIIANMSENQRLSSLRDLLLPKLMSGEILVNSE